MEKRILKLADKYRIDYGGDYSRNAKEHELDLLAFVRAVLSDPTQQPSGEVTDYVRVPARVVELLAIINRDGVIKRASELQEVYRLINAARAGEKQ
ncbi:putative DNA-directed RNA polymerase domain protein [Burkholderia pseudomallei MSHR7343]|uniref:hypothetical protein n=1 Tax=Burkholderia pseudomallei TaxID=28450 RepID=UPI000530D5D1|nr:hypothetical protein [Burkholderia pseudomallei]KGS34459.1 putative DNA-directed RNA polymerase domain protein [Burkholderia pseudomallei MSHR7343]